MAFETGIEHIVTVVTPFSNLYYINLEFISSIGNSHGIHTTKFKDMRFHCLLQTQPSAL